MDKPTTEIPTRENLFNAAVATLMRLDSILIDIKKVCIERGIPKGTKQHYKYRLVKAFYVQSVPLIKEQDSKDSIKKDILNIKLKWDRYVDNKLYPGFSDDVENQLDDVLILIQEALQKSGHFMPEKRDTGL